MDKQQWKPEKQTRTARWAVFTDNNGVTSRCIASRQSDNGYALTFIVAWANGEVMDFLLSQGEDLTWGCHMILNEHDSKKHLEVSKQDVTVSITHYSRWIYDYSSGSLIPPSQYERHPIPLIVIDGKVVLGNELANINELTD